jgi:hypothetical protein
MPVEAVGRRKILRNMAVDRFADLLHKVRVESHEKGVLALEAIVEGRKMDTRAIGDVASTESRDADLGNEIESGLKQLARVFGT